jgi:arylsulfatase A-like enzyme
VDALEFIRSNVQEGASDNRPLRGGKGNVYEGGIRVPSLISWVGHIEAGQSNAFVTAQDVLPTVLDAAGLSARVPEDLDGVSRWSAIQADEEEFPLDDPIPDFRVQGLGQVALIRLPWKLVVPSALLPWSEETPELYNIDEDPNEENDLAVEYPERVEELQTVLQSQSLGPSVHASFFSIALDPDAFGGPEDREPWAEAAQ